MNAIVNVGPGRVTWKDWPRPEPGPGQARIRTAACGICATDLEIDCRLEPHQLPRRSGARVVRRRGQRGARGGRRPDGQAVRGRERLVRRRRGRFRASGRVWRVPGDRSRQPSPSATRLFALHRRADRTAGRMRACFAANAPGIAARRSIFGDGPIGLLMLLLLKTTRLDRIATGRADGRRDWTCAGVRGVRGVAITTSAIRSGPGRRRPAGLALPEHDRGQRSGPGRAGALDVAPRQGKIILLGDYGEAAAASPGTTRCTRNWS